MLDRARSGSRTRTASASSATRSSPPRSGAAARTRSTGRCPSSARHGTGCSTTSTACTCGAEHALRRAGGGRGRCRSREGNVGGGTGMVCHEFKGGIGTASRVVATDAGGYTVGVLVQANYGRRERLTVDGVPVGRELGTDAIPSPYDAPAAAGVGLDHRHPRHRRAAPAAPVRAPGPARRRSASPAWAAPARHSAATCSSPSPPATAACRPPSTPSRARRTFDGHRAERPAHRPALLRRRSRRPRRRSSTRCSRPRR